MIRILVTAAATLALANASAEPSATVESLCFQATDAPARLVQWRLVTLQDGNAAAFVRDAGSKTWTPLVRARRTRTPMADSGRDQVDTEWLEIVNGQVAGRYALSTFGAEVLALDHVDRSGGHKTAFAPAPTPRGVDPCGAK